MQGIAFRIVRLLFWIALAIYLGGLISLGAIAAPAIFKSLEAVHATVADPASALTTPRQLGGEVFGQVLARFGHLETFACIGLIFAVVAESLLLGGAMLRKPWHLLRIVLVIGSLGLLAYDRLFLFPQVLTARENWQFAIKQAATQAGTSTAASRPAVDPSLEATFTELHKSSESLAYTKTYFLLGLLVLTGLANTNVPPMRPRKAKTGVPAVPKEVPREEPEITPSMESSKEVKKESDSVDPP